ncbi:uncharacterized protein LOC124293027 [Neodiprion lecontei]|uniref:Uncharacterized protein LOC124293027 n=1 Tax=Neodiprion lecontei TaxID=441921 RepID=A0ABM3FIP0_NEOLC|nr:uncharacterized protein LOC124293027 [Neodiprion lecontei]
MSRQNSINSVFPLDKKEKPILIESLEIPRSSTGNPKVLRYGWQSLALAEPRDNTDFKPPNGNLHISTYRRLGPESEEIGLSETHKKLEEINLKDDYITVYPHRSTLNMFSFSLTADDDERKDVLESSMCKLYPYNYGCTDYRTTSQIEFRLHFPMKPRPNPPEDKPWLFYRRTLSYADEGLTERNCNEKFYDQGMEMHNKIAIMKMERYRSYDPIIGKFTEPCKLALHKAKF